MERARQAISRLIDKLEGDRIGLIVFAGDAYVQLPITTDYSAAKLFLSTVNTDIIPTQGTAIGKAISLSIRSFDMENGQNKAIIIITDGENHEDDAIEQTKLASKKGVFVHTLGMGLSKGGPIPIYNKYGNNTGYRKDKEGNTIISKLNEQMLQDLAFAGKGTYVRANNTQAGLSALFAEINKMEKKEILRMILKANNEIIKKYNLVFIEGYSAPLDVSLCDEEIKEYEKYGYNTKKFVAFLTDLKKPIEEIWKNVQLYAKKNVNRAAKRGVTIKELKTFEDSKQAISLFQKWGKTKGLIISDPEQQLKKFWDRQNSGFEKTFL
mgnify:CR=1 FL=1